MRLGYITELIKELVYSGSLHPRYASLVENFIRVSGEDASLVLLKFVDDYVLSKAIAKMYSLRWTDRIEGAVSSFQDMALINSDVAYTYLFSVDYVKKLLLAGGKRVEIVIVPYSVFQEKKFELRVDAEPQKRVDYLSERIRFGQENMERLLNYVMEQAYYRKASDVHVEFTGRGGLIRFREGGVLIPFVSLTPEIYTSLINAIKARINRAGEPRDKRKDGSFSMVFAGDEFDVRVVVMPASPYVEVGEYTNERCVLRLLRKGSGSSYSLSKLGLSDEEYDVIRIARDASYGIVLTSGPTSSGKTTTMYAMLNSINALDRKIVSVEDPIEYQNYYLWWQHQITQNMSFDEIIKGILREDPDVCLVGEVRDPVSASALIKLAGTGHLTFSTIHANNAFEVIRRLVDLGVEEKDVLEYGVLFMGQRLLRKSCPYCRKQRAMTRAEKMLFGIKEDVVVVYNEGCPQCGYSGSTKEKELVIELLPVYDEEIKKAIARREVFDYRSCFELVRERYGFRSMVEKAIELAVKGEVSIDEVVNKVR